MKGKINPVTRLIAEIQEIFDSMGYSVVLGEELTSSANNFDCLNIPKDHPARDLWDTFFLEKEVDGKDLLRTHTSAKQVPFMKENKPPIKIIIPGKTFRNEATDATHDVQFHQLEGLCIDKDISLASLNKTLEIFLKKFFGEDVSIRLRPGYFPFVEPGIEADITCFSCKGKGCSVCKNTGWIEILGAGMVHPNVIRNGNLDPNEYSGFAFGLGLERILMAKYGVEDIRLFSQGDIRFLNQF